VRIGSRDAAVHVTTQLALGRSKTSVGQHVTRFRSKGASYVGLLASMQLKPEQRI
jgi:hypothetical protein